VDIVWGGRIRIREGGMEADKGGEGGDEESEKGDGREIKK
jgi:hypothetical protein